MSKDVPQRGLTPAPAGPPRRCSRHGPTGFSTLALPVTVPVERRLSESGHIDELQLALEGWLPEPLELARLGLQTAFAPDEIARSPAPGAYP